MTDWRQDLRKVRRTVWSANAIIPGKGHFMKLQVLTKALKRNESGAMTVDWGALTAAVVGHGMVVMTTVGGGITGLGDAIVTERGARSAGYENQ